MKNEFKKILPLVSKPGRYIGGEKNSVKKSPDSVSLRVALAFPDLYDIGISNLGLQILYYILNKRDDIAAERFYAPWIDMENLLRERNLPLTSLESSVPLSDFDIVGFSLQHELTYTNLLNMIDLGGIPILADNRSESDPLVIAGGPSAFNPESLSDFVDAFFLGDAEEGILEICDIYLNWKQKRGTKAELLSALSSVRGIYVPSFFDFEYCKNGKIKNIKRLKSGYERAKRRVLTDIENAPYPTGFILPNVKPVHDRVPMEVARGCSRFCHFCQAGYVYLPVRERSPRRIEELSEKSLSETGIDEVALLSLSTGDYSSLPGLLSSLSQQCKSRNVNLSFPSLRVDTITPPIMDEINKMRSRSFTIAPEAGSQRLRDMINKGITEDIILETVEKISRAGCQSIKLYFMIGLPTETLEDIDEIIRLSRTIFKRGKKEGKIRSVTVNVSNFVPKSHTPFQWERQNSSDEIKFKLSYLKKNLRDRGISLKWQEPEMSLLEGVFSRGDRKLGKSLLEAYEKGCRFDGWSEVTDFPRWEKAFEATGISIDKYLATRDVDEILPWDALETGVSKRFLIAERNRALEGAPTDDCRYSNCSACGVCDHKKVKIVTFKDACASLPESLLTKHENSIRTKIRVKYSKTGNAAFIGHLDTMTTIIRMLRRSGLPLAYSKGFKPSPALSFGQPVSLGTASLAEYFDVEIEKLITPDRFIESLNRESVDGIGIQEAFFAPTGKISIADSIEKELYEIRIQDNLPDSDYVRKHIENFNDAPDWPVIKKTKRGAKKLDLKNEITELRLDKNGVIKLGISTREGRKIKAEDVVARILNLSDSEKSMLEIIKTDTVFKRPFHNTAKRAFA